MDANTLERKISDAFPGASIEAVDLNGGGDHFQLVVVSDAFENLPLVKRHRLVYEALGDMMRADIHALTVQALTPAEHQDGLVTKIGRS